MGYFESGLGQSRPLPKRGSPSQSPPARIHFHLVNAHTLHLALAISALAVPLGAPAQAPPSSVIAEIHATGSNHYADAQVAAACGLKPGDAVTLEQLQAAADRLAQLGAFSKVNYRFSTRGDKIVLEFQLADAPTVPVTFDNFPWFSDEELSAAIRQAVPFFDGTAPQDGALLDTVTSAVSNLLEARGISGSVQHTLLAQPSSNDMTVQFHLNGPSFTIASLDYGDTLAQTSTYLAERKNDLLNKPFSRFAIELFEFERIRRLYFTTGNLRVQFLRPPSLCRRPQAPAFLKGVCPNPHRSRPGLPSFGFRLGWQSRPGRNRSQLAVNRPPR